MRDDILDKIESLMDALEDLHHELVEMNQEMEYNLREVE
jgi:hypothetical protein